MASGASVADRMKGTALETKCSQILTPRTPPPPPPRQTWSLFSLQKEKNVSESRKGNLPSSEVFWPPAIEDSERPGNESHTNHYHLCDLQQKACFLLCKGAFMPLPSVQGSGWCPFHSLPLSRQCYTRFYVACLTLKARW
jgi:hypothetical protein